MNRTSRPSRSSLSVLVLLAALGCRHPAQSFETASANGNAAGTGNVVPGPGEVLITVLGTNDIHGGLDRLASWARIVDEIRTENDARFPEQAMTILLDGGDQFQGTLVSNFNEGKAMFRAFERIGYDLVVPGNHDYDFGPVGWLDDVVLPVTPPHLQDKRGALKAARAAAPVTLISANTYVRATVGDGQVAHAGCTSPSGAPTDWAKARRPDFLPEKPYVIKEAAGVRMALIGFDNVRTYETTQGSNVDDLCFRDIFATLLEIRAELEGKADVFLLAAHEGNLPGSNGGFRKELGDFLAEHPGTIDAVVAAHSHQVERYDVHGVPVIQSGSGGTKYGRIDLIFDTAQRKIVSDRTKYAAGIAIPETAEPATEGMGLSQDVAAIVAEAKAEASHLASRVIGSAEAEVKRSRKDDSPLANALTDQLRLATGADLVFINSATIRDTLPKSPSLTYENLFKVLPFSSRTFRLKPISAKKLVELAKVAVQESGEYGILCFSGMRVAYTGSGPQAKLAKVTLSDGTVLFDQAQGGLKPTARKFTIVALDFIIDPVSGVKVLKDLARDEELGVFRELIAQRLIEAPVAFPKSVDGRSQKL